MAVTISKPCTSAGRRVVSSYERTPSASLAAARSHARRAYGTECPVNVRVDASGNGLVRRRRTRSAQCDRHRGTVGMSDQGSGKPGGPHAPWPQAPHQPNQAQPGQPGQAYPPGQPYPPAHAYPPGQAYPYQPGHPAPNPYGQPPQMPAPNSYGQPPQMPPPQMQPPQMQPPQMQPAPGWPLPPPTHPAATPQSVPASPPEASMFKRSLGRAFRLRIEPHEVSPRNARRSSRRRITDPYLQAFLAWRRSVLFLVALALLPLTALRLHDAFTDDLPDQLKFIVLVPAGAEALLCVVCWYQLKNWTRWRRQRRALAWVWAFFMIAPFLVFLIPVESIIADLVRDQLGAATGAAGDAWAGEGGAIAADAASAAGIVTALKVTISIYALLTLAPKAVSLLAGTIRAGLVTKMLFPGTAGPGWIVVLATPLYTLFVFTLLDRAVPDHGQRLVCGRHAWPRGRAALDRARGVHAHEATTHEDAVKLVAKARGVYVISILAFAGCLIVALGSIAKNLGTTTIVTTALSFEANVLILTSDRQRPGDRGPRPGARPIRWGPRTSSTTRTASSPRSRTRPERSLRQAVAVVVVAEPAVDGDPLASPDRASRSTAGARR